MLAHYYRSESSSRCVPSLRWNVARLGGRAGTTATGLSASKTRMPVGKYCTSQWRYRNTTRLQGWWVRGLVEPRGASQVLLKCPLCPKRPLEPCCRWARLGLVRRSFPSAGFGPSSVRPSSRTWVAHSPAHPAPQPACTGPSNVPHALSSPSRILAGDLTEMTSP